MYFVVLRRTGPEWRGGLELEDQSGWTAHAGFMDGLVDDGTVVLGGPLEDEVRVVLVMACASADEARAILAADPWSGTLLTLESVDRWTIRLDGRTRASPG